LLIVRRVEALGKFLATDDGKSLLAGYKRATNILRIEEKKDGTTYHGKPDPHLYLQSEEREVPAGPRGLPTYSFTTTERGQEAVIRDLRDLGVQFKVPTKDAYAFATQSVFFADPAGNHYAVYTPSAAAKDGNGSANGRITGVGYIEVEAPDVAASIKFYTTVLGFELTNSTEDARQATLKMASGQTLILTRAPFSSKGLIMSRKVPGPHIAFYVPAASWNAALAQLEQLGIANGDRGAAKERHAGQGGTYMDDPAGYVIQYITDGME